MAPGAGDLTTVATVEQIARIKSSTDSDAIVQSLITAFSALISNYCNRNFVGIKSYSEIRNGSGTDELVVANVPLVAVQSLTVDTVAVPAQTADGSPGYFIVPDSDQQFGQSTIALYGYCLSRGRRNVRITYTAGWPTIPVDIAQACVECVQSAYKRTDRGPDQISIVIQGQNISWSQKDFPATVKTTLQQYYNPVPL